MLLERLNFLHVALANLTRKRVSFLDLTIMHGRGQEGKNDSLNRCRFHVWLETVRRTLLCCMLPLRVTWTSRGKKNLYIFIFFQVLDQIQYHVKGNSFQMNHTVHTSCFIIRVLYYFLLFYLFVIQCCD